jgi:hypothetical protein
MPAEKSGAGHRLQPQKPSELSRWSLGETEHPSVCYTSEALRLGKQRIFDLPFPIGDLSNSAREYVTRTNRRSATENLKFGGEAATGPVAQLVRACA